MTIRSCIAGMIGGLLICTACGCGGKPQRAMSQEVPVAGTVTLDGKPLAGAEVTFSCNSPPGVFSGATDDNGKYKLFSSFGGSTQIEGQCSVRVSKLLLPPGVAPEPGMSPIMQGATESIPGKYLPGGGSELTASVPAGGGEINFDLTSK